MSHRSLLTPQVLFLTRSFLFGHSHAAWSLARARVRVCSLASHRQAAAVTQSAIASDVHQAFDVHLDLLAQVAFDSALLVEDSANAIDFLFREFADALVTADAGFAQHFVCAGAANAINVCQTNFSSLISWQVDACDACHSSSVAALLTLSLFMLWIRANNSDDTLAVDDLAVVAHFLDRCPDFHRCSSLPCCGCSAGKLSRAINGNSSIRIDIEQPGAAEARFSSCVSQ